MRLVFDGSLSFDVKYLAPFLVNDELKSNDRQDFISIFPAHPHRGLERFIYIIKGEFEHSGQIGNKKNSSWGCVIDEHRLVGEVILAPIIVLKLLGIPKFEVIITLAGVTTLTYLLYSLRR